MFICISIYVLGPRSSTDRKKHNEITDREAFVHSNDMFHFLFFLYVGFSRPARGTLIDKISEWVCWGRSRVTFIL